MSVLWHQQAPVYGISQRRIKISNFATLTSFHPARGAVEIRNPYPHTGTPLDSGHSPWSALTAAVVCVVRRAWVFRLLLNYCGTARRSVSAVPPCVLFPSSVPPLRLSHKFSRRPDVEFNWNELNLYVINPRISATVCVVRVSNETEQQCAFNNNIRKH